MSQDSVEIDRDDNSEVTRTPRASTADETVLALYADVERGNLAGLECLLTPDAYVLPGTASPGTRGDAEAIAEARRWLHPVRGSREHLRVRSRGPHVTLSETGRSAWMWDSIEVDRLEHGTVRATIPMRVSGLLIDEDGWRVAAAHWSVPYDSNEEQRALRDADRVPPGVVKGPPATDATDLAVRLADAVSGLKIAELFADHDEIVAIGSAEDEVFEGAAAREAWEKFAGLEPRLEVRGGIDGGCSVDGTTAWLATQIDITFDATMPYRFFFVWHREDGAWKLVVSHDSASLPTG